MKYAEYMAMVADYSAYLIAKGKSAKTQRDYNRVLKAFAEFLAGNPDEDITDATTQRWMLKMSENGLQSNTIRYYTMILHTFFEWASVFGKVSRNPMKTEAIPDVKDIEYSDDELLTLEEINRVLTEKPSGMHGENSARNRAIVVMLIQSGLRSDELRSLALSDLDFDRKCVHVRFGKGNKQRYVPFPAESQTAVREYLESGYRPSDIGDDALLFGSDADESGHPAGKWQKFSAAGINAMVKRYVKSITGKDVHTHSLRHAAASLWDDMGASIRDVQLALGHSSCTVTEKVYVSVLNRHRAAESINALFDGNN